MDLRFNVAHANGYLVSALGVKNEITWKLGKSHFV